MISETLIETAIDRFGRLGFEGASTRDIARASGTAMSSITYHFGGKQGLYLAAADHIAACITERLAPVVVAAEQAETGSAEQAIDRLLAVLDTVAVMMMAPESEAWSHFIVREQQSPSEAFDRLYDGAMRRIVDLFVLLVSRIRTDLDDRELRATGLTLFGQALVLRVCRATVCRVLGTDAIDGPTATLMRQRLRANALCILSETAR